MKNKEEKYLRIIEQLKPLLKPVENPISRMATICAVLHHKHPNFFWTGFYMLSLKGELEVGPDQGPLACLRLKKDTGVCWSGINKGEVVIVEDVHKFEGHIACNPLSKSEIVSPLFKNEKIVGILDVDSDKINSFDMTDAKFLTKLMELVYIKE